MITAELSERKERYSLLFAILFLIVMHTVIFKSNFDAIQNKILSGDVDGYWHLLRVEKLYETKNWFDSVLEKSNAPYGEKIHWGRSFDVLLLSGAYLFSIFADFRESLYWWGVFISPFLHLLTMFSLVWAARPIIGYKHSTLIAYMLPFQSIINNVFHCARPDHHSLILLLFTLYMGINLRIVIRHSNRRLAIAAGILASILLWSGIETIIIVLSVILFFGIIWILSGNDWAYPNFLICSTLFISSVFFLFIDQTVSEALIPKLDHLSIVYVFLFSLIAAFWSIIIVLLRFNLGLYNTQTRIKVGAVGLLVCALSMYYIYPDFYYGPMANVNPEIYKIYVSRILEFESVFATKSHSIMLKLVIMIISLISPMLLSIYLKRTKGSIGYEWSLIIWALIIYCLLSLYQIRWVSYLQLLSLFPMAKLLSLVLNRVDLVVKNKYISLVRPLILAFFCLAPLCLQTLTVDQTLRKVATINEPTFKRDLCVYLNNDKLFVDRSYRLLTSIWIGPLILYKTPHEIIGTPAHRNESGILDTYYVMTAVDDEKAHNIIRKRGIDVLVLTSCDEYNMENSFYTRLWNDHLPEWLESLPVPTYLNNQIKVFRVKNAMSSS